MNIRSAIILSFLCAAALAQTTQSTIDPELLKKLTELDSKAAAINDMSARFEQQKFTPLLKKPIVSRGTVRATRTTMLWLTDQPEETRMRIDEKLLQLFYVDQKILEQYPIAGKLGSLAANPLPRLKSLREQFKITAESSEKNVFIRLTPVDEKLAENVDHILVEIDQESGVVRRFEMIDPDNERTVIEFSDYMLNPGLKDHDLDLQLPKEIKIVKPLERIP